jgi:hypothetical protein
MQQKIQAQLAKSFFAVCANLVYDIRSVHRKLTSSLVTVYGVSSPHCIAVFFEAHLHTLRA